MGTRTFSIGERILIYRRRRGLSRRAVAELCGRTGEWLRQIETGLRPLDRLSMLIRLAEVLHVADLSELTALRGARSLSSSPLAFRYRAGGHSAGQPPPGRFPSTGQRRGAHGAGASEKVAQLVGGQASIVEDATQRSRADVAAGMDGHGHVQSGRVGLRSR